ncbi:MAG: SDR family NAD(P)-dependent oxidoreductase [Pararhizobium sp.]
MRVTELFDVSREVVMVTGGGTGIGRALAGALVENGASVVLVGRDVVALEATRYALKTLPGRVMVHPADIRCDREIGAAFEAAEAAFGTVGVLVNNAAIAHRDKSAKLSRETMREVFATNVEGALLAAEEAARRMIRAGVAGSIINVGSVLCHVPMRQVAAYAASKAALSQMTRTLALEWAKHRIRVNEIRPGWFETKLTEPVLRGPAATIMARQNPMRRLGSFAPPCDLEGAVLLLASRASAYMTGSAITVDGGHSLGC